MLVLGVESNFRLNKLLKSGVDLNRGVEELPVVEDVVCEGEYRFFWILTIVLDEEGCELVAVVGCISLCFRLLSPVDVLVNAKLFFGLCNLLDILAEDCLFVCYKFSQVVKISPCVKI